jgi:alanine dehydrogenase
MIIGVPKEIKTNENRVALTPAGALELTKRGHTLFIQEGAGVHSGYTDKAYAAQELPFFLRSKKYMASPR